MHKFSNAQVQSTITDWDEQIRVVILLPDHSDVKVTVQAKIALSVNQISNLLKQK